MAQRRNAGKLGRCLVAAALCTMIAACKVELHSGLEETEANEMVAVLTANGISAEKGAVEKGLVTLNVESSELPTAVELLRENGYPKDKFNDLGAIFKEQGLISSPLEERVRFIYGLSQAVSETLTQIDGVVTARVHIVAPEAHPLDNAPQKATAAVFLKTRPGVNLDDKIPQIKMLVQASVEGLTYENVVVSIFEANPPARTLANSPPMAEFMGVKFVPESQSTIMAALGGLGGLALLLVGSNVYFARRALPKPEGKLPVTGS